jgi:hypothetical protein
MMSRTEWSSLGKVEEAVTRLPLDCVLEGDCLHLLSMLPDESVDLALFSPPYDQVRDYGGDWALDLPRLGTELLRVMKDGGVCAVVTQDGTKDFAKSLSSFRLAVNWCDEVGWRLCECCVYAREGRPGAWWRGRFRVDHEYILIFLKGERPRYFDSEHLRVPSKFANAAWSGSQRKSGGSTERVVNAPVHSACAQGAVGNEDTARDAGQDAPGASSALCGPGPAGGERGLPRHLTALLGLALLRRRGQPTVGRRLWLSARLRRQLGLSVRRLVGAARPGAAPRSLPAASMGPLRQVLAGTAEHGDALGEPGRHLLRRRHDQK